MQISEKIVFPDDLKKLDIDELKTLSEEIREQIMSSAEQNGGHLASNLGIVELTIALHYVFDFKSDRLVFDVGHQCYTHKILTGRKDSFSSMRARGGISGFPDRDESEYDAFTTGHAGASVGSGLGLCYARDEKKEDYYVVDVVGDGALVNGLNLEAMTSSAVKPKKFIVILNDNGMSISKNSNGLYRALAIKSTGKKYVKFKRRMKKVFGNSFITKFMRKSRDFIKKIYNKNYYIENFGFKYIGGVDGHDLEDLIYYLKRVKDYSAERAVFLHVNTVKGKGFDLAEERPELYHGVNKKFGCGNNEFSDAFGEAVSSLMERDEKVVAITAGMLDGTGLKETESLFPKRVIDVGIAEEYAVTLAGGMASGGLKPIVAVYSTFLQRAYDEIIHDVCLSSFPVIFCIDRAGFVGADGKTHQGVFDLSYLISVPGLNVFAPSDTAELKEIIDFCIALDKPCAIRYPNGTADKLNRKATIGESLWETLEEGEENYPVILAVGPRMIKLAYEIRKATGEKTEIVNARSVKPLDEKYLDKVKGRTLITLEENAILGGFGQAVSSVRRANGDFGKVMSYGVKDDFVPYGTVAEQMKDNGLTAEDILKDVEAKLSESEVLWTEK